METKTKFGLGQIGNHTPKWATWVFRISLYVISFALIAVNTLNVGRIGLTPEDVKDLNPLLSLLIPAIHALTRMIGISIAPDEYQINQ